MRAKKALGLSHRLCNIGKLNAAVLPLPVCANPMISLPFKAWGIDSTWIPVGRLKPNVAHDSHSSGITPRSANVLCSSTSIPVGLGFESGAEAEGEAEREEEADPGPDPDPDPEVDPPDSEPEGDPDRDEPAGDDSRGAIMMVLLEGYAMFLLDLSGKMQQLKDAESVD